MKLSQLVAGALIWSSASGQPLTFCGPEPCLVPLQGYSCEDLILNFKFLGSCCSLVDIPATGGCRVEVGGPGNGNCAWVPFCEPCDPTNGSECGREFRTTTSDSCPVLTYNALAIQAAWEEEPSPPVEGGTAMPSQFFEGPPTCLPTAAPVAPTGSPPSPSAASSVGLLASYGAVAAGTAYATLF
jgi:hypothetical protein